MLKLKKNMVMLRCVQVLFSPACTGCLPRSRLNILKGPSSCSSLNNSWTCKRLGEIHMAFITPKLFVYRDIWVYTRDSGYYDRKRTHTHTHTPIPCKGVDRRNVGETTFFMIYIFTYIHLFEIYITYIYMYV